MQTTPTFVAVIFCPPFKKFPVPPPDLSLCRLIDCPECSEKMWLSEKKENYMNKLSNFKDTKLFCYDCFEKYASSNPYVMENHRRVDI